ncbi:MAG: TRAP transporter small permease [Synergistaceae bacterium]|nr:TRAP transporter small permease [Synergistaceae bacterium]
MKKLFDAVWVLLRKIENFVMIVSAIVLVILVLTQVALRYIFKLPLMGVEELATMTGFWMYMLGAASGSRERNHIREDLVYTMVKSKRTFRVIQSMVTLATVVLACIMTSWCWDYALWSIKSWERSPALMIPMVFAQVSLLVSSALMAFYFFIEFIDNLRQAAGKPKLALPKAPYDE